MKLFAALIAFSFAVFAPTNVSGYSTATKPVIRTEMKLFPAYYVEATVYLDSESVITMTSEALRHPIELEYSAVLPAGEHKISVKCKSTRLPHDWRIKINGDLVSASSLKCE